MLKPVILPCLCRICKGCALAEEAKAQQQQPAAGGGKKGKGRKRKRESGAHANTVYDLHAVVHDAGRAPPARHGADEAGR